MLILGFTDYATQARALAEAVGCNYVEAQIHRFPDGECKVTLPDALAEHVVVCRSLDRPNDKLVELLLVARTARTQGVRRLTLVAPYLCYMRQDIAFRPGEAISQRIIGAFLAELFDDVVTVDPHLHRTHQLGEAVPLDTAVNVSAAAPLGDYLQRRWSGALVVGPDLESAQWVEAIAGHCGMEWTVATKERFGDRDVQVSLPELDLDGRAVVLVDDIASTARTLIQAAGAVRQRGATSIQALVTHALFDEEAFAAMRRAGIGFVGSTDSITHPSNVVSVIPQLATALGTLPAIQRS